MTDQQHRDTALPDARDQLREPRDFFRRQSGRRLVQQERRRLSCEGPRDLDEALHSERQVRPELVRIARVAHELEQRVCLVAQPSLPSRDCRQPSKPGEDRARRATRQPDFDIFDHAHRAEQLRGLKRAKDSGTRDAMRRQIGEVALTKRDPAIGGPIEPAEDIEQRGLPGSVRPDEPVD